MPLPKDLQTRLAQQNLTRIDPEIDVLPPTQGFTPLLPEPPARSFNLPPTNDRPVLVQSQVIVPANSSSPGNSVNLINPNGEAMEIHEIKFSVQPFDQVLTDQDVADGEFPLGQTTGGQVAVEMQLGGIPLTNGQVPIWGFGLARYLDVEQVTPYGGQVGNLASYYVWSLRHPLYIPAGVALSVAAKSLGLTPGASVITIGLSGVTVEDTKRDSVIVPWVCHWEAPPFEKAQRGAAQSSETDLVNMGDQDLWIERFMCRLAATYLPRGLVVINGATVPDVQDSGTAVFDANGVLTATVKASSGAVVAREATPLRALFGSRNRAWQVSSRLAPQEFIRVSLVKVPDTFAVGTTLATDHLAQAFISMIGWRTVKL